MSTHSRLFCTSDAGLVVEDSAPSSLPDGTESTQPVGHFNTVISLFELCDKFTSHYYPVQEFLPCTGKLADFG